MSTEIEVLAPGELALPELAVIANREHELAREAAMSMIEHAVRCGEALIAVKAQLRHGEWLPWLAANFDATPRHAQRYMLVAANATRVSHSPELSLRKALEAVSSAGEHGEPSDEEQPTEPKRFERWARITDLKPHPRQYRGHPPDQIEHLKASISRHRIYSPVVVARDDTILAGHGRTQAAAELGMLHVPVRRLDLDPFEAEALKILTGDNDLVGRAGDNDRQRTEILRDVRSETGDLVGTGYDDTQLAGMLLVTRPAAEIEDTNAAMEWMGVADYVRVEQRANLVINFDTEEDRDAYFECLGAKWVKPRVTSIRWPVIGTIEFALRPAFDDGFDA